MITRQVWQVSRVTRKHGAFDTTDTDDRLIASAHGQARIDTDTAAIAHAWLSVPDPPRPT